MADQPIPIIEKYTTRRLTLRELDKDQYGKAILRLVSDIDIAEQLLNGHATSLRRLAEKIERNVKGEAKDRVAWLDQHGEVRNMIVIDSLIAQRAQAIQTMRMLTYAWVIRNPPYQYFQDPRVTANKDGSYTLKAPEGCPDWTVKKIAPYTWGAYVGSGGEFLDSVAESASAMIAKIIGHPQNPAK